jgi:hypothetical protein
VFEYLVPARPEITFEKRCDGEGEAGIAKTTGFKPGFLEPAPDVRELVGQDESLIGDNFATPDAKDREETGRNQTAIDKHEAFPAGALATIRLAREETELLPQYIDKAVARSYAYVYILAVQNECYGHDITVIMPSS